MDATGLLAPVVVLATVVERCMEAAWNVWERARALAAETLIRHGDDQAEKEKLARDPDYVRKLLFESATYTERKRILTLVVGSLTGMFLSAVTGTRFFEMTFAVLQIPQPAIAIAGANTARAFDMVITGLIIGAGTQPAHALINWIYFAQSVQKEVAQLRKGERTLSEAQALNQILVTLGVPQGAISDVLALMQQYNINTVDDLVEFLRSSRSGVTEEQIEAAERVKAARGYLLLIGRGDLLRLLP